MRVQSPAGRARERPAVGDRARGVRRPVGAVGTGGQHGQVRRPRQLERGRERELLAAPAGARARHGDRGLAPGDEARRRRERPAARDERAGGPPRLAGERPGEDLRRVAERRRPGGRAGDDERVVADDEVRDAREDPVVGLRRLRDPPRRAGLEPVEDAPGRAPLEAKAPDHRQCLRVRARVGCGRPRRDHIDRVPDHVRERQGEDGGRRRRPGELPALQEREVLANGVELADRGAGREQEPREPAFFLERDRRGRGRQERRAAAGDRANHEVVGPRGFRQSQELDRGRAAALVRHRMTRLDDPYGPGPPRVAVLDDHEAAGHPVAEDLDDRRRHGRRRLPRPEHEDPGDGRELEGDGAGPEPVAVVRERAPDERLHLGGSERRLPDPDGDGPARSAHGEGPRRRRSRPGIRGR